MTQTGEAWPGAELYRRKAELLLAGGATGPRDPAAAVLFRHAIALARDQSTKLFELRPATSLARLWLDQGRWAEEVRGLFAPIHGRAGGGAVT